MRKSKEQAAAERAERERARMQEQEQAAAERQALRVKQQAEREELKERQAKRRKDNATTNAGGYREGAGRPPKDDQERETYTFYGTYNEREKVRNLLRVLRAMEQDQQKAFDLLYQLDGITAYELLTAGQVLNPIQKDLVAKVMPELMTSREK
jgi:hypothetical protein